MEKYNFIQNHWKGKLIKHSSAHITLASTMLDDSTKNLLEQVGLPIIMPSEDVISFLPFSHLSKFKDKGKDFYIMGDLSANLSGIMLLGLEMQSGTIYAIRKTREQSVICFFVNSSLYQFLMCLATFNMYEDKEAAKIDNPDKLEEVKLDYQKLESKMNNIDVKAITLKDYFWGEKLYHIRSNIEMLELDKEIPYSSDGDEFPDISVEDLPF